MKPVGESPTGRARRSGAMMLNIRVPPSSTEGAAGAVKVRFEAAPTDTLLELVCAVAVKLGAACPTEGFQLSMNKREPLSSPGFANTLQELGLRNSDLLWVIKPSGAGVGELLAAAGAALLAAKPPASSSVTTQMIPPCTSDVAAQTAPPSTGDAATQTLGRPFPSDTGTQTEPIAFAAAAEQLGQAALRGIIGSQETTAATASATSPAATPREPTDDGAAAGEAATGEAATGDAATGEAATSEADVAAPEPEAGLTVAQGIAGEGDEGEDMSVDEDGDDDDDASMPQVFPTPRESLPGTQTQAPPLTARGTETQQPPLTERGTETHQPQLTERGTETQQLPLTARGTETQQLPQTERGTAETQTLNQNGETQTPACFEFSGPPGGQPPLDDTQFSGPPGGQPPVDDSQSEDEDEDYSALLPTQRNWDNDDDDEEEDDEEEEEDEEEQQHGVYEECDRKQREIGTDEEGVEEDGGGNGCVDGGTAFLASTQTPDSTALASPESPELKRRRTRSMTPPPPTLGSEAEGGSSCSSHSSGRKRLRSSQWQRLQRSQQRD